MVSIFLYSKWREKATSKKLEDERRNQELEEARKLQNSLLPKKIPTRKDYDISVYLKSATEVGGDYYDFIENENKDLYAICGDATGHGVVSGIMVSVTKAGLNGINMDDPSTILNNLNSIVKRVNFGRLRMSLSVAKINNGSISAQVPRPFSAPYTASKHAITGLTRSTCLDGRTHDIVLSKIDIGNAQSDMTERLNKGNLQANGKIISEPLIDIDYVASAVVNMAKLPLSANIMFMTLIASKMPFVGRG